MATKKETTTPASMSIHEALRNVQKQLKAPKGQYNSFGKYHYRSAEDIIEAAKPVLYDNGLSLNIKDEVVMIGARIYVKATATLFNDNGESISSEAFAREEDAKKGMDASQVTGATSSYARKYALNGLFAIDDTKDADYLNTSKEYTAPTWKSELANAKNRDEAIAVWIKYQSLHNDKTFTDAFSAKKKELGL